MDGSAFSIDAALDSALSLTCSDLPSQVSLQTWIIAQEREGTLKKKTHIKKNIF